MSVPTQIGVAPLGAKLLAVPLIVGVLAALQIDSKPTAFEPSAVVGEVTGYDAISRELVVRTRDGEARFVVASNALVRQGARLVGTEALERAHGLNAKVRFGRVHQDDVASHIVLARALVPAAALTR